MTIKDLDAIIKDLGDRQLEVESPVMTPEGRQVMMRWKRRDGSTAVVLAPSAREAGRKLVDMEENDAYEQPGGDDGHSG